ncbi:hypothetical protein LEP1GSC060_3225 [Leptospira weilii serovar Ranarum str. ICFT]|uniref:Uncharacterized protein n=3 Tax=Leptospira TaxID=171 RepID=N1W9D7_9LEPT|nr:hypothetical protein LEP1GSC194_3453 [Leptospira alstonii serovar Sichuan str. 79601]EMY76841.1 hypothetical protein LEP1GSC060_3225 [Leptospira weilii serovar Ranarum str. ICFT]EQA80527.1 hypothetical protein LEP1GSC193_3316 [Leptospira alstonii serovar Pingchang str. 80-412]
MENLFLITLLFLILFEQYKTRVSRERIPIRALKQYVHR